VDLPAIDAFPQVGTGGFVVLWWALALSSENALFCAGK